MTTDMRSMDKDELGSEKRVESMEQRLVDIAFRFEGKEYKGWARPAEKKIDGKQAASYHVVLNGVFFGNLSYNEGRWETDSQRETMLVQKTGEQIAQMTQK